MAVFNKDIIKLTETNKNYQKEVYLDEVCQIVMMSIEPGEEIGEETHDSDQTTSSWRARAKRSWTAPAPR